MLFPLTGVLKIGFATFELSAVQLQKLGKKKAIKFQLISKQLNDINTESDEDNSTTTINYDDSLQRDDEIFKNDDISMIEDNNLKSEGDILGNEGDFLTNEDDLLINKDDILVNKGDILLNKDNFTLENTTSLGIFTQIIIFTRL